MEISQEAYQAANSPLQQKELFAEMLFAEFAKMKSAEIAPHLSCSFDVIRREYKVTLSFPARLNESDSIKSDIK